MFLAYFVSAFLGMMAMFAFIVTEGQTVWVWGCLGVIILASNIINYFLSRRYKERFYSWGIFEKRSIFFSPPFSTFFFSFGLAVFILSFFSETTKQSWQAVLEGLPKIYELAGSFLSFMLASLLFLPILVAPLLFGVYLLTKARSKMQRVLFFMVAVVLLFIVLFVFIYSTSYSPWTSRFDIFFESSIIFFQKVTMFLVSFSPIYWFYFLFIGYKKFTSE